MWIKLTTEYVAGLVSGAGLLLLMLALATDAGLLSADGLKAPGTKFAALAVLLAGSGMKWRGQRPLSQ